MKTAGILLAGGLSSRFGSPKAFATYRDRMFYEIALQLLTPFVDKLVISTSVQLLPKWKEIEKSSSLTMIVDDNQFVGKGPLAGIYSGMKAVEADQYLLLPCDMPFMGTEIIEELLNHEGIFADVVSLRCQNREHPLVGLYRRSNLEMLSAFLEQGNRKVMTYLNTVDVSWVQAKPEFEWMFQNINYPESLHRIVSP